jgi:hypothetical protein
LADIFDEVGDAEVFSTEHESAQLAAASVARGMKTANAAASAAAPGFSLNKQNTDFEKFCSKGKEGPTDEVTSIRLRGILYRWKNRFDSFRSTRRRTPSSRSRAKGCSE